VQHNSPGELKNIGHRDTIFLAEALDARHIRDIDFNGTVLMCSRFTVVEVGEKAWLHAGEIFLPVGDVRILRTRENVSDEIAVWRAGISPSDFPFVGS
jgi:hypothetical protein